MSSRRTCDDDNLIDWGAFEEDQRAQAQGASSRSRVMKIASTVLAVSALAGAMLGALALVQVLDASSAYAESSGAEAFVALSAQYSALLGSVVLLAFSLLSFIPAAFGFQAASSGSFGTVLVFGVLGILLPPAYLLLSMFSVPYLWFWVILIAVAVCYLIAGLWGRAQASPGNSAARRKEEMWDEEKIWR